MITSQEKRNDEKFSLQEAKTETKERKRHWREEKLVPLKDHVTEKSRYTKAPVRCETVDLGRGKFLVC